MATQTLRPNGDLAQANNNIVGGSGSRSAAWNDNSDSTWVQFYTGGVQYVTASLGDLSALAAGEAVLQVRVRIRFDTGFGVCNTFVSLKDAAGNSCAPDTYNVNGSAGLVTYTGGWKLTAPDGGAWTEAKVNALQLDVRDLDTGSTNPRITEVYVDVLTNRAPTATGSTPNASSTTTLKPTFGWSYSDYEGDAQQKFRVKVFSAAQYSAGGFDPNTSTPTVDSGEVVSSATTWACSEALENNTAYRAFVFVYDGYGWNAVTTSGPYAYTTTAVEPPAEPYLIREAVISSNQGPVTSVTMAAAENLLSADDASLEGSIGTWVGASATLARVSSQAAVGTYSLELTATTTGYMYAQSGYYTVEPDRMWVAAASFRPNSTARAVTVQIQWYDAAFALISTAWVGSSQEPTEVSGQWVEASVSGVAPSNAAHAKVLCVARSAAIGEKHFVDRIILRGTPHAYTTQGVDLGASWKWPYNKAKNPSFAKGAENAVDDWTRYHSGTGSDPTILPYNGYLADTVGRALYMYGTNPGTMGISQIVRARIGDTLTVSAWVYRQGGGTFGISCTQLTPNVATVTIPDRVWTLVSLAGTVNADGACTFILRTADAGFSDWYIQDVQVCDTLTGYDPATCRILNNWTPGGLSPDLADDPDDFEIVVVDGPDEFPDRRLRTWEVDAGDGGIESNYALAGSYYATWSFSVDDYETRRARKLIYRGRRLMDVSGAIVASDWSGYATLTADEYPATSWFLSAVEPSSSDDTYYGVPLHVQGEAFTKHYDQRQGTFAMLGRSKPVVLSDVASGAKGTLDIGFADEDEWLNFDNLRKSGKTMLLRSPYGDHLYVVLGNATDAAVLNPSFRQWHKVSVAFTEVDEPAV